MGRVETMKETIRTREPEFTDRLRYLALCAAVVAPLPVAAFLFPDKPLYALPVVFAMLFWLIWWHARNTAYRCDHCGHEFAVSAWRDAFSPHLMTSKYLKCPECGQRSWAKALVRER